MFRGKISLSYIFFSVCVRVCITWLRKKIRKKLTWWKGSTAEVLWNFDANATEYFQEVLNKNAYALHNTKNEACSEPRLKERRLISCRTRSNQSSPKTEAQQSEDAMENCVKECESGRMNVCDLITHTFIRWRLILDLLRFLKTNGLYLTIVFILDVRSNTLSKTFYHVFLQKNLLYFAIIQLFWKLAWHL